MDCSEPEVQYAVTQAINAGGQYVPSAGEIRSIALERRERDRAGSYLAEIANSPLSDPQWPECQEFLALMHSVSGQMAEKHKKRDVFIKPVPMDKAMDMRRELLAWYLKQDLYDGTPRSKSEIAAIKASIPQRKRKHADLQHR